MQHTSLRLSHDPCLLRGQSIHLVAWSPLPSPLERKRVNRNGTSLSRRFRRIYSRYRTNAGHRLSSAIIKARKTGIAWLWSIMIFATCFAFLPRKKSRNKGNDFIERFFEMKWKLIDWLVKNGSEILWNFFFFFYSFERIRTINFGDKIWKLILFKELKILGCCEKFEIFHPGESVWFSFEVENYIYNNSKRSP